MTLLEKQQWFAGSLVPKLLTKAVELGYHVTFGECYRTPQQAQWNAEHGTGIFHSLHTERLAIDLNLFRGDVYLTQTLDYEPLGMWWETQSTDDYTCYWGGRFGDGPHFSVGYDGRK